VVVEGCGVFLGEVGGVCDSNMCFLGEFFVGRGTAGGGTLLGFLRVTPLGVF